MRNACCVMRDACCPLPPCHPATLPLATLPLCPFLSDTTRRQSDEKVTDYLRPITIKA